ncbi:YbhB/YbcL family Raf kinase inhibitor-like protein [Actinomadura viridis]|uniref:Raf kinase inhibitor-like YbhB/YbcL family protein n=1 Tax=Actinomadura viridis TaxID=58110 RepID=A0A931DKS0_9ACTN|nr:YbhB/YbcL family Raf kinase inhibitor-like protein [Actinomadura viridis]MBG6089356.1 Raf kinase inhibitor-like YbhB/YbcL family protein [Actinomadura viridis]
MYEIEVRSRAFSDHTMIPAEYAHASGDLSPPLEWSRLPEDAVEIALVCVDPDAPRGTFVHWLLAGIPPDTTALEPGETPAGAVAGRNDYGTPGYGGPHPPPGDEPHRYFFRMYGLSEPSGLARGFSIEDFRLAEERKVMATGTLVGTYAR